MWTPHERQRPRRSAYERIGTLSYQAISCPQSMQAEPGLTSDRRSGTRAATTFKNEPRARPGARAIAARPIVLLLSATKGRRLETSYFVIVMAPTVAPEFGGSGAPTGMFLITGSGLKTALLNVASKLPTLIGPSTVTPFLTKVIVDEGCDQRDPWKVCELLVKTIAVVLAFSATSVSIELLPLVPCQALTAVLQGLSAQNTVALPLKVIVPAAS